MEGVEEIQIRLTPEAPLVGFHGMATEEGLDSLGLILLDTLAEQCTYVHPDQNSAMSFLDPYSEVKKDQVVEDSITDEEKYRADALEAILTYDSIEKARQGKEDILR